MAIDQFTQEQFEKAIPVSLVKIGFVNGELVYRLTLGPKVAIDIRSSIGSNGLAASTGNDSIRCWIFNPQNSKPIASKVDAWTTRVPGWLDRLTAKVEMLAVWQKRAGFCPKCKNPLSIWKAATGKNTGRHMSKCFDFDCSEWGNIVDEPITPADHLWFQSIWTANPVPTVTQPQPEPQSEIKTVSVADLIKNTAEPSPLPVTEETGEASLIPHNGNGKEPTIEQKSAIEADPGHNYRVMAGPGAGKTYVVEHRYEFLVTHNIPAERILVVTYAKPAADELLSRITKAVTISPEAMNQISTIHALCYRILRAEGDKRRFPDKEWEVKAMIREISENLWTNAEGRPGTTDVLKWISLAKYYGLSSANDLQFYISFLGEYNGRNQHEARRQFDIQMRGKNYLTFDDMIFEVEQKLINDPSFRNRWQSKFQEVIVDEGQDTNAQALRILITLSLEPGDNRVYRTWKPGYTQDIEE